MPVPNDTFFGEKPEGGTIKYGEVRAIADEQRQLEILKSRLDTLLIRQINELSYQSGNLKVYSPFPLTVLSLLSIETIGQIISDYDKIRAESDNEQAKTFVTPIYLLMDKALGKKPTKIFYEAFEILHGKEDKKMKRYSDIIHKYQRNTFSHGYQSKGVYLTEEKPDAIIISENEGCLFINPYFFLGTI